MKTRLTGLLLLLLLALPFSALLAQDAPTCAIDVSAAQDLLAQAADAEPEAALPLLAAARDNLLAMQQACAANGIALFDQTFTTPDRMVSLSYPNSWTVGGYTPSETGGVLFISSSLTAQSYLQQREPEISGSEQAVQVLVGQPETRDGDPLQSVLADFDELLRSMYTEVSTIESYTLDGRSAAMLAFRSSGFDGVVVAIDLGGGRFAAVRGLAAPGGLSGIRTVAEQIAISVQ
jgi:hypothetical protein